MASQSERNVNPANLPAVLYLNQRLVFDMLASLEDGISTLKSIETATTAASDTEKSVKGSLGFNNVFALLGVSFGGGISKVASDSETHSTLEEKVHTPTSLFVRLREHLEANGLIRRINIDDIPELVTGEFIESKLKLRRSTLVQSLQGLRRILSLASAFEEPTPQSKGAKSNRASQNKPSIQNASKLDALIDAVSSSGSEDLIGIDNDSLEYVLTTESGYFVDPRLNDVIDGEFWVLGKITRVVKTQSDPGIDLLRKSALGMFSQSILDTITTAMGQMNEAGVIIPDIRTTVQGPAIQVIPIAIFA